ncbi:MAG: tRNA pseudouridine(55) synthase TruB [Defluviitaleaceae bacterium]|nr:tRNA pseudouridine(55) synthase TruB [Defluviitaleaceae bacterium]
MTSHDVVFRVRRIFGQKAGHTGTLDPAAEGVLPVCLGAATKLAQLMSGSDKEYRVEIIFGTETDTQDSTGNVMRGKPFLADEQAFDTAIKSFLGEYAQIPPMYSAIKVKGKKLYELARKGVEVEREPRVVRILSISAVKTGLPHKAELLVRCSKGAYMRTLCEDIGRKLDSCAHMGRLVRTEAAGFTLSDTYDFERLRSLADPGEAVIPIEETPALRGLRRVRAVTERDKRLLSGGVLTPDEITNTEGLQAGEHVLAYTSGGILAAVYENGTENALKPFIMLYTEVE